MAMPDGPRATGVSCFAPAAPPFRPTIASWAAALDLQALRFAHFVSAPEIFPCPSGIPREPRFLPLRGFPASPAKGFASIQF